MRRSWVGAILIVALGAGGWLVAWPEGAGTAPPHPELKSRSAALGPILEDMARRQGMSRERFRVDPAGMALEQTLTGRFRLTEYLMAEPLRAPATVEAFARHLASIGSASAQFAFLSTLAWPSGQLLSGSTPAPPPQTVASLERTVELLYQKTGKRFQGPDREQVQREAGTLPTPVRDAMARVLTDIYTASRVREAVVKESEFKLGGAFGVRSKRTSDRLRAFLSTWWGADSLSTNEFESVVAGLQTVDLSSLYESGRRLAEGLEEGARTLSTTDLDLAHPAFQYEWYTPRGRIAVGGTGANTYQGSFLFVLDLGGDDVYTGPGAVSGVEPAALVLDLGGDDRYEGESADRAGPGGAILGYAAVVDLGGGADSYTSQAWGGGFGFLGMGWIEDDGGDDTYRMSWLSQGAGMFGIGILFDAAGNDDYFLPATGDTLPWGRSQGFAGPAGMGLLLDKAGNDSYRLDDMGAQMPLYLQGTASGVEPYHAGGLGFLMDVKGDDRYEATSYSQGQGSLGGLGALFDLEGHDVYRAVAYSQGVGSDRGVGILMDGEGNDEHILVGRGTPDGGPRGGLGLGDEFGLGCFVDGGGDDSYSGGCPMAGVSYSQGGGMFLELGGRDRYDLRGCPEAGAQVISTSGPLWRMEVPGFALFVDLEGQTRDAWPFPEPAGGDGFWPPQTPGTGPAVGGGYCAVPDSSLPPGAAR
jgi:hypothetical protein